MSRKLPSLSLAAVLMSGAAWADVPNVATDIAPVHSLVAQVMNGVGEPNLIVPAGASPHEHSLRPSEAAALQDAGLVIWMGADLAPSLESAIETLSEDAHVITLLEAEQTSLLDFRESALFEAHAHGEEGHDDHGHDHGEDHAHDDHDHDHSEEHAHDGHDHDHGEEHAHDDHDHDHDHSEEHAHDDHDHDHDKDHAHDDHGHAHGAHDPHAWLSPTNAAVWLDLIAAELSELDPENAATYAANAAAGRAELDAVRAEVSATLDAVRGQSFILFHDAFQYFERDFDFPASGAISLSDAAEPSPARISEIQERIRDQGIDCVLAEPQFNPSLVTTVLDGTDANTGVIDPIGVDLELGPSLYPTLIRNVAATLAECL